MVSVWPGGPGQKLETSFWFRFGFVWGFVWGSVWVWFWGRPAAAIAVGGPPKGGALLLGPLFRGESLLSGPLLGGSLLLGPF